MTDTGENTRNYYRNQGAEAERERIINLLKTWSCGLDDCSEWQVGNKKIIELCSVRNNLIVLIKEQ